MCFGWRSHRTYGRWQPDLTHSVPMKAKASPLGLLISNSKGSAHDPRPNHSARAKDSRQTNAQHLRIVSPSGVRDYLRILLHDRGHEVFVAVFMDAQHRVIANEEMFRGTLTQTSVYPREVVKAALAHNAASILFAHNHPSGVTEPSRADELLTQALKQALALVDVKVLDHFVIAGSGSVSFAERGLL